MSTRSGRWQTRLAIVATVLLVVSLGGFAFASGNGIANTTPGFVQSAQNLGPENPSAVLTLTVRLNQHDLAGREALVKQFYDKKSPQYHKFLTPAQYAARFAPTADEMAAVIDQLKSAGLQIVSVHPNNLYVTARGSVAAIQKAFGVQINRYNVNGASTYSNSSNVVLTGAAAKYVRSVQGLHPVQFNSHATRPTNPDTGAPFPAVKLPNTMKPNAIQPNIVASQQFFESQCWRPKETHTFATAGPKLPIAVYSGNRYGGDISGGPGHYPPCGYEPATLQTAYGLNTLYNSNLDGTGQTVVIVDAFGSPTAAADLSVFSSVFNLPQPNFTVYNPNGIPPYNSGWAGETTLDIEWAHAVAPGANIALVQSIDNYDNNLQNAVQYALDNQLGNVISNSYGSDEAQNDAAGMDSWNDLNLEGALLGVSINFSTGDSGDFVRDVGVKTVSVPSDSPYATAIGGTSDFVNADNTMKFEAGWGTSLTRIANPGGTNAPNVPPVCAATLQPGKCFYFGAGGGESQYFPKPTWQAGLPGTGRQQPDISMTADPYTGVTIIWSYNSPGNYSVGVIGGTSASCPMFSGLWAIVNQANGGNSVGLAGPYLYSMPAGAIKDVKAASPYTVTDVAGTIFTGGAPIFESPSAIVGPDVPMQFTSAFYQGTSTRWYAIGFGSDSSLTVGNGWDAVTGMGTPNGLTFVNGVLSQVPPPTAPAQ